MKSGRRYRRCAVCKEIWNVSAVGVSPKRYVCPRCEKQKEQKKHEGLGARRI
ncbi:MAG: hypothetical protein V8Q88_05965 [Christensenellales bacterium]|nr:MAG TPA: RUBREDOXIN TRANSPORT, RUBREDOXIN, GUILLARDIA THETA [Caudoviricetes sp.]DAR62095.1 MAG TPA: RUBREDOXIN TRANSPORT, RUBREDOXIN, GUILLARDIA THETA [Caudoviricetes sp.]DAS12325.1 MAG TPA: RUBREDOXIN TRANSPORT, RUBREDOXIN, GUILLARDIA THETA [Caudoviricetes sp.]